MKNRLRQIILIGILTLLNLNILNAQETTRSPASFDFNDNGIVFITPDSTTKVIMRFRLQSALTFNTKSDEDLEIESSDMSIRRMRLRFGGTLYDPRLSFNLQLSFARGDMDYEDTQFPNIIRDAMVFWSFNKKFQIGVGQTKLPGNRQRVISSGDLQFPDRSLVNSRFTLDRDFGVQGLYSDKIENVYFNLRGAISTGDGRYAPKMQGANFAYTGRFELLPFGKFTGGGDYYESDMQRETSPKLSLGVAYSDNKKSTRTRGQLGKTLYEARDMQMILSDFIFKYNGFAAYGEFAQRKSDDPITYDANNNLRYVYAGKGYLLQASYLFKNNFELASRIAIVDPENVLKGLKDAEWNRHIAANLTYYLHRHRAKIQFELTHNTLKNEATKLETKNWIGRINTEIGI